MNIIESMSGQADPAEKVLKLRYENRLELYLVLHSSPGLRFREKLQLSRLCSRAEDLLGYSAVDVDFLLGRPVKALWEPAKLLERAKRTCDILQRLNCVYLQYEDPCYPPLLRETAVPAFGLFIRGRLPDPDLASVAVVGTREPSVQGAAAARRLGAELACAGVPVVSGLARGIDASVHRGCLIRGGFAWAVLPCGIDRIYPLSNRSLAAGILDGSGALISEYPPGEELRTYRFPERNRIIAGIARACIVVEAPLRSGALITVEHALSEGRDVWVHGSARDGGRWEGLAPLVDSGAPVLDGAAPLLREWGLYPLRETVDKDVRLKSLETQGKPGVALSRALSEEFGFED